MQIVLHVGRKLGQPKGRADDQRWPADHAQREGEVAQQQPRAPVERAAQRIEHSRRHIHRDGHRAGLALVGGSRLRRIRHRLSGVHAADGAQAAHGGGERQCYQAQRQVEQRLNQVHEDECRRIADAAAVAMAGAERPREGAGGQRRDALGVNDAADDLGAERDCQQQG